MAQFFYNLLHWQYFGILAIVWVVIDLIWIGRWKALIERIGKLITKPWIFVHDEASGDPPLYPREFLEQLALNSRRNNKSQIDSKKQANSKSKDDPADEGTLASFANVLRGRVFDKDNPMRTLGYVLALAFFVFFIIADAITIANTMVLLGLMSFPSTSILARLDFAILGGALLSAIVGVWMLVEMTGTEGELINTNRLT